MYERVKGEAHSDTLDAKCHFADFLILQETSKDIDEAEALLCGAAAHFTKMYGEQSVKVVDVRWSMSEIRRHRDEHKAAVAILQGCVATLTNLFGSDDRRVADKEISLARL